MTDVTSFLTVLTSILAVLAVVIGSVRWLWGQGGAQKQQLIATERNTTATRELTDAFRLYTDKTDGHLLDHERRITRLEASQEH